MSNYQPSTTRQHDCAAIPTESSLAVLGSRQATPSFRPTSRLTTTTGISDLRPSQPQRPNQTRNPTPTRIPQPTNPALKTRAPTPALSPDESTGLKRSHAGRSSPTKQHVAPRRHRPLSMPPKARGPSAISAAPLRPAPVPPQTAVTEGEEDQDKRPFTMFANEDPFVVSSDSATLVGRPGGGDKLIESVARPRPLRIRRKHGTPQPTSPSRKPARQDPPTLALFPRAGQQPSPGSVNTTFSTPGRDEMERKKGNLDDFAAEEGPFGRVKSMKELEESRKKIEERRRMGKTGRKKDGGDAGCGCLVM